MKIVEYQTQLPIQMDEFLIGQLYMVAKASRQNSGGGDGIEIIKNEPFEKDGSKGQYTFKRLHIASRVPGFLRAILPKTALILEEESWNAFPYTKTVYRNVWLKERFQLVIESSHSPDAGTRENALNLTPEELKIRKIDKIDLGVKVKQKSKEYKCEEDPTVFKSEKTGRGPLVPEWWKTAEQDGVPVMTAYKVVKTTFKWFGMQTLVEKYACNLCRDIFRNAHAQQFCWMDEYYGMTIEDVRKFEAEQNALAIQGIQEAPKEGEGEGEGEGEEKKEPEAKEEGKEDKKEPEAKEEGKEEAKADETSETAPQPTSSEASE